MDSNMIREADQAIEESLEKIFGWIEEKKYFKARDELLKHNEADIAEMFEEMLEEPDILESTIVIYRLLPKDVSVEVFSYLPSEKTHKHFSQLSGHLRGKPHDAGLYKPAERNDCRRSLGAYKERGNGRGDHLYMLRKRYGPQTDRDRFSEHPGSDRR